MLTENDIDRIHHLKAQGYSQAKVAKELGISRNTVRKYWNDPPFGEEGRGGIADGRSEPDELLIDLSKWLAALCWAIPLTYTDENALMLCLRKEIDRLDPLIVKRLKENESARKRFFVQFIRESELGSRYRSERAFGKVFAQIDFSYQPLPELVRILKQVLDGKQVTPQGPYFPPFIKGSEKIKAKDPEWIDEGDDISRGPGE